MTQILDGVSGVRVYIEDILVWRGTQKEHDECLYKTLARAKTEGLMQNAEKRIFGQEEISFLGDRISSKGIEPSPDLVKCLVQDPIPTSKKEVQHSLGAVNYHSSGNTCRTYRPRLRPSAAQ